MERGGLIVGKGEVIGVAVHAAATDTITLTYVHLHRKRNGVHVRTKGEATGISQLAKAVGTRVPLALVLDTDRCIHRVLARAGDPEELLRHAFPNASLDDLYTSVWQAGAAAGASMARRSAVKDIVDRFHAAGFRVVRAAVGPWGLLQVRELLQADAERWTLGGHMFTFTEGTLTAHAKAPVVEEGSFSLGTDTMDTRHALAFAGAWEHSVPAPERHDAHLPEVAGAQQEERARYRYESGLVFAAVLLVLLIGGERFIAHRLTRSQDSLKASVSANTRDQETLDALRKNVEEMEGIGEELGLGRDDKLARQAAQVAATVPAGIRLDRLMEHPLRGPLKEREPLVAEQGVVRVSGTCRDAGTLDGWMSALKGIAGISKVELRSYAIDQGTGAPRFELELAP